jgi:hypothetical protein
LDQAGFTNDKRSIQPTFDEEFIESYKKAKADLAIAIEDGDDKERIRLETVIEDMEAAAKKCAGLRGKPRDMNNPHDNLRPRINGTLRTAYKNIASWSPQLANHFGSCISSVGDSYCYRPAAPSPAWIVSQ